MLALQRPRLLTVHEREPELAVVDSFLLEHPKHELDGLVLVHGDPAPVRDLDFDHGATSAVRYRFPRV